MKLARLVESIGSVIGGVNLESAVLQAAPNGLLSCRISQRRTTAELGSVHARQIHLLRVQEHVLGAGLAENLVTRETSIGNQTGSSFSGDVHDQNRGIYEAGQCNRSMDGFSLGSSWVAGSMVFGSPVSGIDQSVTHPLDHGVILSMNHRQGTMFLCHHQYLEHLGVVHHQSVVGHIDLERGDPLPNGPW